MIWRSPALIAIGVEKTKQFEHPLAARDADVCCATKNKKLELNAAAGDATHSASCSRWSIQKNMRDPKQSSLDNANQL